MHRRRRVRAKAQRVVAAVVIVASSNEKERAEARLTGQGARTLRPRPVTPRGQTRWVWTKKCCAVGDREGGGVRGRRSGWQEMVV